MDNQFQEPEERQNVIDVDFNPLDEAVNEKSYSRPNINASAQEFTKPIEEPRFAPPPLERKNLNSENAQKKEPFNPELRDIPKKDKEMAASQAAKMILQGYSWMHDLANKGLVISEKKLNKLQNDGEINLNAMIDYDYGRKMRAGEFFREWNDQINKDGGLLQVTDEFKEEVTPVLERVLAKRGIGMTDEQMLIYMFGKDIAAKGLIFFQMKGQMNSMIASIKEATTNAYAQASAPPPPQPPTPQEPTPQPETVVPTNQYETPFESEYEMEAKAQAVKPDVIVMPSKRRGRPKS
jgi:hypothetical protein